MKPLIVEDLHKSIAGREIIKGISFEVENGEIFGLVGPNGAGKTTTLRMIATILTVDKGKIEIFGLDIVKDAKKIRRIISYLPEEAGVYKSMRGIEYLKFIASFFATGEEYKKMIKKGVEISKLEERLKDKVSTYSKGMVRRLLIARALMTNPKLLILDEPTSGLDVLNSIEIRERIKEAAKNGSTVVVSSHNMLEIEYLCDKVALIHEGRIIEYGSPLELKEKYSVSNLEEVFKEVVQNVEAS